MRTAIGLLVAIVLILTGLCTITNKYLLRCSVCCLKFDPNLCFVTCIGTWQYYVQGYLNALQNQCTELILFLWFKYILYMLWFNDEFAAEAENHLVLTFIVAVQLGSIWFHLRWNVKRSHRLLYVTICNESIDWTSIRVQCLMKNVYNQLFLTALKVQKGVCSY